MAEAVAIVHLVDDDASVRAALADLLESVGLCSMQHASAQDYLDAERPDAPACLVLDVRMRGMSGLELQNRLREDGSTVPIIFITAHGDVPMSVRAMKNGAIEFLQKPISDQALLDAVHHALASHAKIWRREANCTAIRARLDMLNSGERAVLDLVLQGMINKLIGVRLGVSEITVKVRRAAVMRKLQVTSLAELIHLMRSLDD